MSRKVIDCRDYPSESGCSLMIAGEEDEVLDTAVVHAQTVHGEQASPDLRDKLRGALKDEEQASGRRNEGRSVQPEAVH